MIRLIAAWMMCLAAPAVACGDGGSTFCTDSWVTQQVTVPRDPDRATAGTGGDSSQGGGVYVDGPVEDMGPSPTAGESHR